MAEIEAAGASARVCEVPIVADASQSIEQAISQAQGVTAVCAFSDYVAWQVLLRLLRARRARAGGCGRHRL